MSSEIPTERMRPYMDPSQSVHSPASISPTSGISGVEHQGDRLGLLAFQDEPMVDRSHTSCLLNSDDAVPIGQSQLTASSMDADASQTINQTMQQAPDHLCDVFQQKIEQIHKVLQEQGRLLTLLGTGLTFPAYVSSLWSGLPPALTVINSQMLPIFPVSSPPSDGRKPEDHPHVATCSNHTFRGLKHGGNGERQQQQPDEDREERVFTYQSVCHSHSSSRHNNSGYNQSYQSKQLSLTCWNM